MGEPGSLRDGQQAGDSYGRLPQARDTFLAPSSITGVEPSEESRGAPRRTLIVAPSVMGAMEGSKQGREVTDSGAHPRPLAAAGRTDLGGVGRPECEGVFRRWGVVTRTEATVLVQAS